MIKKLVPFIVAGMLGITGCRENIPQKEPSRTPIRYVPAPCEATAEIPVVAQVVGRGDSLLKYIRPIGVTGFTVPMEARGFGCVFNDLDKQRQPHQTFYLHGRVDLVQTVAELNGLEGVVTAEDINRKLFHPGKTVLLPVVPFVADEYGDIDENPVHYDLGNKVGTLRMSADPRVTRIKGPYQTHNGRTYFVGFDTNDSETGFYSCHFPFPLENGRVDAKKQFIQDNPSEDPRSQKL